MKIIIPTLKQPNENPETKVCPLDDCVGKGALDFMCLLSSANNSVLPDQNNHTFRSKCSAAIFPWECNTWFAITLLKKIFFTHLKVSQKFYLKLVISCIHIWCRPFIHKQITLQSDRIITDLSHCAIPTPYTSEIPHVGMKLNFHWKAIKQTQGSTMDAYTAMHLVECLKDTIEVPSIKKNVQLYYQWYSWARTR